MEEKLHLYLRDLSDQYQADPIVSIRAGNFLISYHIRSEYHEKTDAFAEIVLI